MGAVSVDADVARLADGLAAVGDAAAAEAARLAGDGGVLGPAVLQRAVEGFDDAWRCGLRVVGGEARAAAEQVRAAERRYRAVEQALEQAAAACR